MEKYDDNSPMPFGKYQGIPLEDVPASYLLWLYESQQGIINKSLLAYVEENYDVLEAERYKGN